MFWYNCFAFGMIPVGSDVCACRELEGHKIFIDVLVVDQNMVTSQETLKLCIEVYGRVLWFNLLPDLTLSVHGAWPSLP